MVCMVSLLPLNGCISAYFDNFCLNVSAPACFKVLFPSMWSIYINSKTYVLMTSSLMNFIATPKNRTRESVLNLRTICE